LEGKRNPVTFQLETAEKDRKKQIMINRNENELNPIQRAYTRTQLPFTVFRLNPSFPLNPCLPRSVPPLIDPYPEVDQPKGNEPGCVWAMCSNSEMPSMLRFDVKPSTYSQPAPDDASKSRLPLSSCPVFRSISAHRVIADHGVTAREDDVWPDRLSSEPIRQAFCVMSKLPPRETTRF